MIQGVYTAASAMYATMVEQARIGHNLTNAETIGYKALQTSLSEFSRLMNDLQAQQAAGIFAGDGVITEETTDLSQGPLAQTSRELDLALAGPGFLVVRSATGDYITRAGRLHRDAQGMLVTSAGHAVLGQDGGPITLPLGRVQISEEGIILVDGAETARLQIVESADPGALARVGGTLFQENQGALGPAQNTRIMQGYVEQSNVNSTEAMASLVSVARMYQLGQRLTVQQSEILERTVNELARI